MLGPKPFLASFLQFVKFLLGDGEIHEPGPNVIHCLGGRVNHVGGVEAVVAQLVKHDLIGGKIIATFRELGHNLLQCEKQGAFA